MSLRTSVAVLGVIGLTACGGGGGGGGGGGNPPPPPPPNPPLTGVFIDAPVAGLAFRTSTQSGETNGNGEFQYESGEQVSFSYGGISLGSATGQEVLTPLDLHPNDQALQGTMMSFLQSLDADADTNNGITLTAQAADQVQQFVDQSPQLNTFAQVAGRSDYNDLVSLASNRTTWIPTGDAVAAFDAAIQPFIDQGRYQRPATNPPPPPPPPSSCANAPRLDLEQVIGGPFTDCGPETSTRIPDPTAVRHGFGGSFPGDPAGMNFQTACILPGWETNPDASNYPDLPNVPINGSDQIYYNTSPAFGVITFNGVRVQWTDQNGGSSDGFICGNDARDIEYNGVCVCP